MDGAHGAFDTETVPATDQARLDSPPTTNEKHRPTSDLDHPLRGESSREVEHAQCLPLRESSCDWTAGHYGFGCKIEDTRCNAVVQAERRAAIEDPEFPDRAGFLDMLDALVSARPL